ncbi:hypothetical protein KIK84_05205 [Curvibacter sp. CHRR-16]|uniref:hypothetical protein n=1 Tax=Curvibacter sp. CHRR-16 TaxID=2835872 RepID=UPI001BD98069|nr:hypothetical protein [Curvibacter sp. CHRR-16]MBT0569713.1 hypothetical protein [Curvibacter sp. CHRR-16]
MWACLVGLPLAGWFIYLEKRVDRWTTRILKVPGGARFESHGWTVEILRAQRQIHINASQAELIQRQGDDAPQITQGPVQITLDAAGLRIVTAPEVQQSENDAEPKPTGKWSVRFVAKAWEPPADLAPVVQPEMPAAPATPSSPGATADTPFQFEPLEPQVFSTEAPVPEDEANALAGPTPTTEVLLTGLAPLVVRGFAPFATQVGLWIERMERILIHEEAKRRKEESDRLAAVAEAAAKAAEKAALTQIKDPKERIHEQLNHWRQEAGFTGTTSAYGANRQGFVDWFIDLDPTGKITLVNGDHVIHTTLRGASVSSLTGELEVAVLAQDANLQSEPKKFRVLKGESPEVRRAWKDRLLMLRDDLNRNDPAYKR